MLLNRLHPHTTAAATATATDYGVPTTRRCVLARVIESDAPHRLIFDAVERQLVGLSSCLPSAVWLSVGCLVYVSSGYARAHGHATHDCC